MDGLSFLDRISSKSRRARSEAALRFVRECDTLIVCKPDRLARSIGDLRAIVSRLEAKGIALWVLSMGEYKAETHPSIG